MLIDKSAEYHAKQQLSRQWRDFLSALGAEFNAQHDREDLRRLMLRIGTRFANGCDVSQCTTLADLQRCVNRFWLDINWGWVELEESADFLDIQHRCSPLLCSFGDACSGWTPAFLEGVYQHWFEVAGIDPRLRVQQVASLDAGNLLVFKLATYKERTS